MFSSNFPLSFRTRCSSPFWTLVLSLSLVPPQCLSAKIFPYKLGSEVSNSIPRNQPPCFLLSFHLFSELMNKPDSSRGLTIFIISFIPSFKFINVVVGGAMPEGCPDLKFFKMNFCICNCCCC